MKIDHTHIKIYQYILAYTRTHRGAWISKKADVLSVSVSATYGLVLTEILHWRAAMLKLLKFSRKKKKKRGKQFLKVRNAVNSITVIHRKVEALR